MSTSSTADRAAGGRWGARTGTVLAAGVAILGVGATMLQTAIADDAPLTTAAAGTTARVQLAAFDGAVPDRSVGSGAVDDAAVRSIDRAVLPARAVAAQRATRSTARTPAAATVAVTTSVGQATVLVDRGAADRTEAERAARQAERKAARKAERKAERKAARKAERKAERKAARKAERKAQRHAQRVAKRKASRTTVRDVTMTGAARSSRSARTDVSLTTWRSSPHARMIVQRESNGQCDVVSSNGLWRGTWQMTMTLWRGYGGRAYAPSPERASCAEQDRVAYRVWLANWWTPWGG